MGIILSRSIVWKKVRGLLVVWGWRLGMLVMGYR